MIGQELLEAAAGILVIAVSGELGQRLGSRWWSEWRMGGQIAAAYALGGLLLGLLIVPLSLLGLVSPAVIRALQILLCGLLYRPQMPELARKWWTELRLEHPAMPFLCAGMLCLSAFGCLSPTVHLDALVYHYTLPQLYLEHHRFYWTGLGVYDGTFHTVHFLYTWALGFGGERCANLLGVYFLAITALALGAAAEEAEPSSQGLTFLLAACSPILFLQSSGGLCDLPAAAYSALALTAWARASLAGESKWWLVGLWAGISVSVRVTSLSVAGGLTLAAAWLVYKREISWWRPVQVAFLGMILMTPWVAINTYQTGHPFYPIGARWSVRSFQSETPRAFPWSALTPIPAAAPDRAWQESLCALIVPGLLLFPLCGRKGRERLVWPVLTFLVFMSPLKVTEIRYALPGSVWWIALAGCGWRAALRGQPRLTTPLLLLGLACGFFTSTLILVPRISVVLGRESEAAYLSPRDPNSLGFAWLAGEHYSKVLLTDPRAYRCPLDFSVVGEEGQEALAAPLDPATSEGAQRALKRRGCDLVLWDFTRPDARRAALEEVFSGPSAPRRLEDLRGELIAQMGMDQLAELLRAHKLLDEKGNLTYSQEALPQARSGMAVDQLRVLYLLTHKGRVVFARGGVVAVEWPAAERATDP